MNPGLEDAIRRRCEARDWQAAATEAVAGYGDEVYGFLVARLRGEDQASEAFAQTCEDLWCGLEQFAWRCSFRTWIYALARHAAARLERSPHEQSGRRITLSKLSEIAERVRSRTQPYLRTEVKDRLAALQAELGADDQTLLILRINRNLEWGEAAIVLGEVSA